METKASVTELQPTPKPADDPVVIGMRIGNVIWQLVYGPVPPLTLKTGGR